MASVCSCDAYAPALNERSPRWRSGRAGKLGIVVLALCRPASSSVEGRGGLFRRAGRPSPKRAPHDPMTASAGRADADPARPYGSRRRRRTTGSSPRSQSCPAWSALISPSEFIWIPGLGVPPRGRILHGGEALPGAGARTQMMWTESIIRGAHSATALRQSRYVYLQSAWAPLLAHPAPIPDDAPSPVDAVLHALDIVRGRASRRTVLVDRGSAGGGGAGRVRRLRGSACCLAVVQESAPSRRPSLSSRDARLGTALRAGLHEVYAFVFGVFGRGGGRAGSLDSCGFARL